jgi:hypothetical protein
MIGCSSLSALDVLCVAFAISWDFWLFTSGYRQASVGARTSTQAQS